MFPAVSAGLWFEAFAQATFAEHEGVPASAVRWHALLLQIETDPVAWASADTQATNATLITSPSFL